MSENWKPVVGHDGYEVSDLGGVRSLDRTRTFPSTNGTGHEFMLTRTYRGKILTAVPNRKRGGHLYLFLGRGKIYAVHRLVLEAFKGPCPEGMEALHGNGDETVNELWNLRWGTHDENMKESSAHGAVSRGDNHFCAKLTAADVLQIRASTDPSPTVAARYGVGSRTIRKIRRRETWAHVV